MYSSILPLAIWLLSKASAQSTSLLTVQTPAGTIQGSQCKSSGAGAFLSIPFGEPPIGDLRFAPPKAYISSDPGGVLHATTPAPNCIQFGSQFIEPGATSEDW